MIDGRFIRICCPIDSDHFIFEHINIPHHQRARSEIVRALLRHITLGFRTVIAFTSYFDRKDWCSLQKFSSGSWAYVEGGVWAEGSAVRQVNDESGIVSVSPTLSSLTSV